jgi:hypothetical protein
MFDLKPANLRRAGGLGHNMLWSAPEFRPLSAGPGSVVSADRTLRPGRQTGPGAQTGTSPAGRCAVGAGLAHPSGQLGGLASMVSLPHASIPMMLPVSASLFHFSAAATRHTRHAAARGGCRSAQRPGVRNLPPAASLRHSRRLSLALPAHRLREHAPAITSRDGSRFLQEF